MSKIAIKRPEDILIVTTDTVTCDGGNPAIGHPQVYLHIDHKTNDVVCPYCEKRFVKES
ncbi:MAG: zinc-finger domain-containing protein [Rickettsiales bacterium]|nr:zinc-finger domain-containing protein [Rickettsiales bacterium]